MTGRDDDSGKRPMEDDMTLTVKRTGPVTEPATWITEMLDADPAFRARVDTEVAQLEIGDKLAELRKARKVSQAKLGKCWACRSQQSPNSRRAPQSTTSYARWRATPQPWGRRWRSRFGNEHERSDGSFFPTCWDMERHHRNRDGR